MTSETLPLSALQQRIMAVPETVDMLLGGGRGGAKSYAMALLALRHVEMYGNRARVLYIRQTYKGIADFEQICRDVFFSAYGSNARYNASEHVWRFPNGAIMELGQLEGPADYSKYQGRSFTLLLVDEAGHYASPELLDRLRSNLRGPKDIPIRQVMAANPGDAGHHWLAQRYVFKGAPWQPFYEEKSKRYWIYAPSTFLDNPFIDQAAYRAQLEASCPADPELLRAWLEGDWAIARGAFFSSVIEEKRNAIDPWPHGRQPIIEHDYTPPERPADVLSVIPSASKINAAIGKDGWQWFLAHDYGSSAPSVTYVVARSPGGKGPDGRFYPRGSLVLVDELATNEPGHLDKGMGYTVPRLAEEIREMSARWNIKPDGVADDAIFSNHGSSMGTIADEFRRHGVYFNPAKKGDRIHGWQKMRTLLSQAGMPDKPGLYISRSCEYFWSTVPYLGRDPRRVDDVDSRTADHGADACRYACLFEKPTMSVRPIKGFL